LFISEYFKLCFYFHGHQKGAHLWQKGAIQGSATEVCGGQLPQTAPLDPPLFKVVVDKLRFSAQLWAV